MHRNISLPKKGIDKKELTEKLEKFKANDVDWKKGRNWSLVYYAGSEHTDFIKQVYAQFFTENAAGPTLFPSLRRFEAEVVSMVANLMGGTDTEVGTMTSGGTESILLAIKAYRDFARKNNPDIKTPEIIVPQSVHPAFLKAAGYFDIKFVYVSLDNDYKADISAIQNAITDQTICIVASAPTFSHGVVDPIEAMGHIAQEFNIGLHVDACLGSFQLPFLKKLGRKITDFDFSVPGVSSISVDLHKNGFTAKGASVVLYKNKELRQFQYYINTTWPGGIFASPTMQGTRSGGVVASAWAAMMALGEEGYMELVQCSIKNTEDLINGILSIPGFYILGKPEMNVFSYSNDNLNINSVAQRLDLMGWRINRQNNPSALHMIVTPNHEQAIKPFLADLRKAVDDELKNPVVSDSNVSAVLYGGTLDVSGEQDLYDSAIARLDDLFNL